jgi:hypothetical protein
MKVSDIPVFSPKYRNTKLKQGGDQLVVTAETPDLDPILK